MIVDIISIQSIQNNTYGDCLLVKTHPIIDSPFGWGGSVDMTREILLIYPNNKTILAYLNNAKVNDEEYFEFAEDGAFSYERVSGIGACYVHNSFFESKEESKECGYPVDLGLSVLWADMNIGAALPSQGGTLFGYGDVSGEMRSEDESDYPSIAITGTKYDIAKFQWGNGWRMPTAEELEELSERCKWTPANLNGVRGNLVTGPSGNSIFMPYAGSRIGVSVHIV